MERSTIHYLKQKGWSNSAIAEAVGCHRDTVSQWDSADCPTALPEVEEPLPGRTERVFVSAAPQGE